MRRPVLSCAVLLAAVLTAQAPVSAKDATVENRLTALKMKINTDQDGDYRVVYDYADEGRTQLIYIAGATLDVRGLNVRKVFAPAAVLSQTALDEAALKRLLEESGSSGYGGWEIRGGVLFYAIEVPEPQPPAMLKVAMDICAERADNMELELTGKDDF